MSAPATTLTTGLVAELRSRSRALTDFGLAFLALAALTLVLQVFDDRMLDGVNVWVKPAKFFLSVGVFALTSAFFFGLVRPDRRDAPPLRFVVWATVGAGSFELAYICLQAARGVGSHFNVGTPVEALMYTLMGIGAVILVGTALPLAWEIARRPAPGYRDDFRAAVVAGLVLTFLLGGLLAFRMGGGPGHAVGPEAGHMPFFGWNRAGGDLRVAHFFGMHMEHVLPLATALAAPLGRRAGFAVLAIAALGGSALVLATFVQALSGQPFLPFID